MQEMLEALRLPVVMWSVIPLLCVKTMVLLVGLRHQGNFCNELLINCKSPLAK